jgi:uncharacterized protein
MRLHRILVCLLLCALAGAHVSAQDVELQRPDARDDAALARSMPELARQAISRYTEPNRDQYLNTLFRLQVVAGRYQEAVDSLQSLIELRRATDLNPASALRLLPFEMLAKARMRQAAGGLGLVEAIGREFRELFGRLTDKTASDALFWFAGNVSAARDDLYTTLERQKGKNGIALADALTLIRQYYFYQDLQLWMPLSNALIAEDDARRYIVDRNVLIKTPDGAQIDATIVRSRSSNGRLPALLVFTIYADEQLPDNARQSAARGYAGVTAYTRGKGRSPDTPVPYEHDGDDVRTVIDWITRQSWSDGRIGMYSGSYNGFTQWAAAKKLPAALKTIVPYVANNPGDGLPMENNVFLLANYAWAFYTTNNKYLDNETYNDFRRWNALNSKWYASGKSYRQIDSVDGTPNKWLQRWLQHPSYDKYWQDMVPYKGEFAGINIPVLTITGYYDDGQQSALRYLKDHYKYNRNADHYLLIGPYDHLGAQAAAKPANLRGYAIDPVAQIDTPEITFQWMDYILRGGKKPDLLKDKINYQVMGTNEWRHAPSIEKMSNDTLTLYLTDVKAGDHYQLSKQKPAKSGALREEVDFADRKTMNNRDFYPNLIVGKRPNLSNGFSFISEPFNEPVEISGTFAGEIKAVINKKDMDIGMVLYEVLPTGQLFQLSYFIGRASYANDMSVRRLLTPGKIESVPFDKTRMVSRRLSKGSRLLVTLDVNKNAFGQINYGTGKDVSDEDINDATTPLQIQWQNSSYIKIPIWK